MPGTTTVEPELDPTNPLDRMQAAQRLLSATDRRSAPVVALLAAIEKRGREMATSLPRSRQDPVLRESLTGYAEAVALADHVIAERDPGF